jgi:hypothetical protein
VRSSRASQRRRQGNYRGNVLHCDSTVVEVK